MKDRQSAKPLLALSLFAVACGLAAWAANSTSAASSTGSPLKPSVEKTGTQLATDSPLDDAYRHLIDVMDQYHLTFDVYTDVGAAGNHFVHRAQTGTGVDLNDPFTDAVHSGCTAIENIFSPSLPGSWGGWYFQNGVLLADDVAPIDNWGEYADAGLDLTGSSQLTFWARGKEGGERVEFFAFGVGWDPAAEGHLSLYPDGEPKVTLCGRLATPCYVTLSNTWQPYTINLTGLDLGYVLGGFGWVTNAPENGGEGITFYLDEIRYRKTGLEDLRLLLSYQTLCTNDDFDTVLRNVAFTYDNALALIAFTALGDQQRATLLADALVYAQAHDRYYTDGRLRNAYQAGDLVLWPGWWPNDRVGTARMPGVWDPVEEVWHEDAGFVGSGTGNLAWAMIALLGYYETWGGEQYLSAAIDLGNWIELHTHDERGDGGYTGGYVGWEPDPDPQLWKSTEHNIDLYVAFERLYQITGDEVWHERAEHARVFVEAMWNEEDGYFWTGTFEDGIAVRPEPVPLDAQTWSLLAFGPNERTERAISYAETHHAATWGEYDGFDFDTDQDMPWFEGTGQMVVSYRVLEDTSQAEYYRSELREVQDTAPNGNGKGIVAAPADGLTTGFEDWFYYNRLHVGATAWFIFAELGYNPYWGTVHLPFRLYLPVALRGG